MGKSIRMKKVNKLKLLQKCLNYTYPIVFFFRFFNEFLMANERHVAKEVRDEYLDTMNKIYYSYFKGYLSRLMKLQVFESFIS